MRQLNKRRGKKLGINLSSRQPLSNNRIESILHPLNNLNSTPYVAAWKVVQIIGNNISTIFDLGNIVILKTRYLYQFIF